MILSKSKPRYTDTMPPRPFSSPLSQGLRSKGDDRRYRTPVPQHEGYGSGDEGRSLSPPPRPRLRLKKRNASSHLSGATQQFLASVAAADIPIPSVEEPNIAAATEVTVDDFPEIRLQDCDDLDIYQHLHARTFSPPKTPALELAPSIVPTKYPDWNLDSWSDSDMESSPEYESSRPSTAFSTHTSSSLFSQLSTFTDDGDYLTRECNQPDSEKVKPEKVKQYTKSTKPRRAPWTRAMSAHLWSTYLLYLQDPRVTPIRLGKSCIPPEGVCARVARQARRSWKGSKATTCTAKSGSSTPLAESSRPYIQWPHTCAATRAHLRELCKLKAASQSGRSSFTSASPAAPFSKAAHRRWNRRSTPGRSPSVFSGQDMAMSLMISTSEAMQPEGPLAQITRSPHKSPVPTEIALPLAQEHDNDRARLGSPLFAHSYGPSSSASLVTGLNIHRQSQTVGPRKSLKSPVRLSRSRSGTVKRRSARGLEDEPRKRPSLVSALLGPPTTSKPETRFQQEGSEPRLNTIDNRASELVTPSRADPFSSSATDPRPACLGSPFLANNISQSFPNRLSQPADITAAPARRSFATTQQITEPHTTSTRSSLASRLAYIDQRLKEFRSRDGIRRRSKSPR